MSLTTLLGLRDTFNGKSLPAYLNELDAERKARAIQEAALADLDKALAAQDARDRIQEAQMLEKIRRRQALLQFDEPDVERRRRLADKYEEAQILLTPKIGD